MSEYEEMLNEQYFVIDSNNNNFINKSFYGFAIVNEKIVFEVDEPESLDGNGVYLLIKEDDDFITIFQDFNGSYGLYLYRDGDYFAISNSFFKLTEYLSEYHKMTYNKQAGDAFLFADLCSYSYKETLIEEIEVIPRNFKVIIDKVNHKVNFEKIELNEKSVSLDSKEAIEILDKWYFKWVNIIRSIKMDTNYILFDLSGGFDSRVVSALWLTANIDLDKVRIASKNNKLHTHNEDFQIATEISKYFNFKINNRPYSLKINKFKDILTPINLSFYTKLGFHKQMYFSTFRLEEPTYRFSGNGGETIKGTYLKSKEDYIKRSLSFSNMRDVSLAESTNAVLEKSFKNVSEDVGVDENTKLISEMVYTNVRNRYHFGKAAVEQIFANYVTLSPLMDSDLKKIDVTSVGNDEKSFLIYALIFLRYCPELLEFKFEGDRKISSSTLEYARKLNEKYPLKEVDLDFVSGPEIKIIEDDEVYDNYSGSEVNRATIESYLKKAFYSNKFKNEFLKYFSYHSYYTIINYIDKQKYFPLSHVCAAMAILKVNNPLNITEWLKELHDDYYNDLSPKVINELIKYNTARIDIKNIGNKDNTVEVLNATPSGVHYPKWLNNDKGIGLKVESIESPLDLKLKCVNDGTLKIDLRSIDFKEINKQRFPIYIDFKKITINGESYLDKSTLVTHDRKHSISIEVKDLDILDIHFEWEAVSNLSDYNNHEITLKDKIKSQKNEIGSLKKKIKNKNKELNLKQKEIKSQQSKIDSLTKRNENLSNKIDSILGSNSWKLTSFFRKIGRLFKGN